MVYKEKKTSSEVFSPFCKKGKRVLNIKLEKFVYTKTHLAIKNGLFFRALKNQ